MDINSIRKKFSDYYQSIGYKTYPTASIIPSNDPTVLFTTAGMQQFKDYYSKPEFAPSNSLITSQIVVRTSDISEVGDATHLTAFEMLGNFRFGFNNSRSLKELAINEAWQFITQELQVKPERIYVTYFKGDEIIKEDSDTKEIWSKYNVKIVPATREDNFWGPTGEQGPCGPTTEIYIDGVEVWNLVFNEYYKQPTEQGERYIELNKPGLDTGLGLERLATVLSGKKSLWEISPFAIWLKVIDLHHIQDSRIIIDHIKTVIFLINAEVVPGKKSREYVLRRLIRKIVFLEKKLDKKIDYNQIFTLIRDYYANLYTLKTTDQILPVFLDEKATFQTTISRATRHINSWLKDHTLDQVSVTEVTELAFYMYESFGFPKELVFEYLIDQGLSIDLKLFESLFKEHQEISRKGLEKKFIGGLADNQERTIEHHTAQHLLLAALRKVLGTGVFQRGSNVTSERLRLDFSFDRKLTDEEKNQLEFMVNDIIKQDLPVIKEEMPRDVALNSGALAEFGQKYSEVVTVYRVGEFSKELCGGPHVTSTGKLGRFKILKEEASSQGVRRIKAKIV